METGAADVKRQTTRKSTVANPDARVVCSWPRHQECSPPWGRRTALTSYGQQHMGLSSGKKCQHEDGSGASLISTPPGLFMEKMAFKSIKRKKSCPENSALHPGTVWSSELSPQTTQQTGYSSSHPYLKSGLPIRHMGSVPTHCQGQKVTAFLWSSSQCLKAGVILPPPGKSCSSG